MIKKSCLVGEKGFVNLETLRQEHSRPKEHAVCGGSFLRSGVVFYRTLKAKSREPPSLGDEDIPVLSLSLVMTVQLQGKQQVSGESLVLRIWEPYQEGLGCHEISGMYR